MLTAQPGERVSSLGWAPGAWAVRFYQMRPATTSASNNHRGSMLICVTSRPLRCE
jgi:hypothetical protein